MLLEDSPLFYFYDKFSHEMVDLSHKAYYTSVINFSIITNLYEKILIQNKCAQNF